MKTLCYFGPVQGLYEAATQAADLLRQDGRACPSLDAALAAVDVQLADRDRCRYEIDSMRGNGMAVVEQFEVDDEPLVAMGDYGVWVNAWAYITYKTDGQGDL
jgi:hypothetical protein